MDSQNFNKSFIVFRLRTSELFNHILALPISISFLLNYSKNITFLNSLLEKYPPFFFNEEALSQFQLLKEDFATAPILSHFDPSLPTISETDASDYSLGSVLSQVNDSGKHPIAFDSHKLLPAELSSEIYYKELLGIFWAFKCWRDSVLFLSHSLKVFTDHSSLQYFRSYIVPTHCQACWAELLFKFHLTITYFLGRLATLPDSLSCLYSMYPERVVDFISKNAQSIHQVLKEDGIEELIFFSIKIEMFSDIFDKFQKEVWQDKDHKEVLNKLARGKSVSDYSLELQAKLLFLKDRVVIPSNQEILLDVLQKNHDPPFSGHPGQENTLNLIKRYIYWDGMNQIIKY
ncbi:hypothetical protein O181_007506 [Austropuccinia psidii MF-1]|uniref:Reverse transcriptase RNase H-like domain-containing protein n=1 Tax=Austropuccinia psidii MF-1 TaxID=1389203 RepID=A0A9Q3BKY0_9BASI|nr:hypothetical protein [Austropuccinia psidii MF-1]